MVKPKDNKKPLLAMGLPVYNGANYLEEALKHILPQTFRDFELHISDNASTDATQKICERYASKDKRIKYYRYEKNMGAAWNFNNAARLALDSGAKYFKWVAHDDNYAPEFLEKCMGVLEKDSSVIMAYTRALIIDQNSKVVEKHTDGIDLRSEIPWRRYRRFHQAYKGHHWANPFYGIIRSEVIKKTPLLGGYFSADIVLLGELALRGKIHEVPDYLFYQRIHQENSMHANKNLNEQAAWYNPRRKGKPVFIGFRWFIEYFKSINRVKIGFSSRVMCYLELLRWSFRKRRRLIRDFGKVFLWPFYQR